MPSSSSPNIQLARLHPFYDEGCRRVVEYYRRRGLQDPRDVDTLIHYGLKEPIIGTRVNCKHEDHRAPFTFVSDVLLDKVYNALVWANRSGSKSYLAALITWVKSSFNALLETCILGGSFSQSQKSYKAMKDFWRTTGLQDAYLLEEPLVERTMWKNGSIASVLTASTKSTRGPHPQRLIMDEIDEMDPDVYTSALSQPQSKHGLKLGLLKLSTNHNIGGVMDEAVTKAAAAGTPFYKWCIWECLKPCSDYSCSTCKLSSYCPGEQMKTANGYYEVDDLIQKLYELNELTLLVEWFCEKIGRDDLVYGRQFDMTIHCPLDLPDFNDQLPVELSIDWGGTSPFSVGAWQRIDGIGWIRFDEIYLSHITNQELISIAKKRPWWKCVRHAVVDPSRQDLVQEWMAEGVEVINADNAVDAGIETQRNALRPVLGRPFFYVRRDRCKDWIREVQSYYEKRGRPVKENDHAQDETRYFLRWVMEKLGEVVGQVWHAGMAPKKEDQEKAKLDAEINKVLEQKAAALDINGQPIQEGDNGHEVPEQVGRVFLSGYKPKPVDDGDGRGR